MGERSATSAVGFAPRQAARASRRSFLRLLALLFVFVGAGMVVGTLIAVGYAINHQYQLNQEWQQTINSSSRPTQALEPPPMSMLHPVNGVDFAIRVPKINYFAAVQEGVSSNVLDIGPGHYPETKWPGQLGTVGVAAHNTYWLKFADVKAGDTVILETRYGDFRYRVTGTKLVWPNDRTVLIPNTHDRRLTLTTCWPLWAGAFATQRLIIFTVEVSPNLPVT
jgi:sortase A